MACVSEQRHPKRHCRVSRDKKVYARDPTTQSRALPLDNGGDSLLSIGHCNVSNADALKQLVSVTSQIAYSRRRAAFEEDHFGVLENGRKSQKIFVVRRPSWRTDEFLPPAFRSSGAETFAMLRMRSGFICTL